MYILGPSGPFYAMYTILSKTNYISLVFNVTTNVTNYYEHHKCPNGKAVTFQIVLIDKVPGAEGLIGVTLMFIQYALNMYQ